MFDSLKPLPADPLLGLITRFREDANANKIDLGVGVYKDEQGNTPVLQSVKLAEQRILQSETSKAYVGPFGNLTFNQAMSELVFGREHKVIAEQRLSMVQTAGGCGALRVAAELVKRANPNSKVWVSDPTWANHVPLLGGAGLDIVTYPYYDYGSKSIRFDEMLTTLKDSAQQGDLVLLHGCCHNPCGADLTQAQWQQLNQLMLEKKLVPFVDIAYQGFGEDLESDAYGVRLLADSFSEMIVTVSCSKNFGLYRERVGAIGYIANSSVAAGIGQSHIASIARGIYSMPPSHGASLVADILTSTELREMWQNELVAMCERLNFVRNQLVNEFQQRGFESRFDFIGNEKGMFSFLGLRENQVAQLASDYAIYMADSSRMSISGLNQGNISYFCDAVAKVIAQS